MNDSHESTKSRRDVEALSAIVVDCGYKLHVEAGPALLESVYEVVLSAVTQSVPPRVEKKGVKVYHLRG